MRLAQRAVAGALCLLRVATARAEPADDDAVAHRERGRALAAAAATPAEMAAACAELEASVALERDAGTFQRLAVCYQKIGRLGAAWHMFVLARDLARAGGLTRLAAYAEANLAALRPARLVIVAPAGARDAIEVTIDGTSVAASAVGAGGLPAPDERGAVGIPVDAGPHRVRATAPGAAAYDRVVDAKDGESSMVLVEPTPAPLPLTTVPAPRGRTTRARRRDLGWIVLGASAALAITGAGFGVAAWSEDRDADAACPAHVGCAPDIVATNQRAGRFALVADVAFTGAVVAASAGAYLVLTRPDRDHASAGLAVAARF